MPSTFKITEKGWKSDRSRIVLGLVFFAVVMLAATLYNQAMGKAGAAPVVDKPTVSKVCVKDTRWMRENHMTLLNEWRDEVVRNGQHGYLEVEGKRYEKSLSNGCMKCHQSKARFCDRCHQWAGITRAGVDLNCWACHIHSNPSAAPAPARR